MQFCILKEIKEIPKFDKILRALLAIFYKDFSAEFQRDDASENRNFLDEGQVIKAKILKGNSGL